MARPQARRRGPLLIAPSSSRLEIRVYRAGRAAPSGCGFAPG